MQEILPILRSLFPSAGMILKYRSHWELLVAVQLSAQCTDKKVNEVTSVLFQKYPTFESYLTVDPQVFERDIFQTGYYRNKTKNILGAAKRIQEHFGGVVPHTMHDMLSLPGVARKTANVVLGNAFGVVEGIAVDTHVSRLSHVLGLSRERYPVNIEKDLMACVPQQEWFHFTYLLIEYGRTYCVARRHDATRCPLGHITHSASTTVR